MSERNEEDTMFWSDPIPTKKTPKVSETMTFVNFPWVPVAEEMSVTVMSVKTVESTLPTNGFGVPDIHVDDSEEEDTDIDSEETMVKKLVRTRT